MTTILTADIGNTTIDLGLFRDETLLERAKIKSAPEHLLDIDLSLSQFIVQHQTPEAIIFCSVSPKISQHVIPLFKSITGTDPIEFTALRSISMKNCYTEPEKVGADRLANAYGARTEYGAPVFVVDIGSAITVDVVSPTGEFIGGIIAPGPGTAAAALAHNTALLPELTLELPDSVLGHDTTSAIQSGIMYGTVGAIRYYLEKLQQRPGFSTQTPVVFTGGWCESLDKELRQISPIIDMDITLKGLHKLYLNELRTIQGEKS